MIKVKNVTKEFSLSRKQRKELGDQYKTGWIATKLLNSEVK